MTPNEIRDSIRILSVFHYIVGGIAAAFACFPLIHLALGLGIVAGYLGEPEQDPGLRWMGWAFTLSAGFLIVMGWLFAGLLVAAGRRLGGHRRYRFCLIVAGVACVFFPFGTVLGVFTLIVLLKDETKILFGELEAPQTESVVA